ncbi:MAG: hypothetical protein IKP21_06395 [Bacteroidales bacterium]|nr:hypothetical protein [Bacteroidales bacterium]
MDKQPRILCIITMVLLLLTAVQGKWHIIPMRSLKGAVAEVEHPRFLLRTWADGSWQQQLDEYLKSNFGFREVAIRLYNQYLYTCYHKTQNHDLLFGSDGYMYERYFVEDYYESRMYKYTDDPQELIGMFDLEARRLARLQSILREQGTYLFVEISPGKDILYPEHLPPQDTMTRTPGPRAYPEYLHLFDKYGVEYIDVLGWFLRIKDSVPFPLMTPLGNHWSNIASVYAFDSIMRFMPTLGGPKVRTVAIGEPYYGRTREPDNDLGRLLNVTFTPRQPRCQYVDVVMPPAHATAKPGLVVIGDSFFWNIKYNFQLDSLFRYTHYWFYNNTVYFDADHHNVADYDLRQTLVDADYVMLSYCSGQLYDLGNGFIVDALLAFTTTDEERQAVRDSIFGLIRDDEHWLQYLEGKSAREGISFEQAMLNDANYLIHTHPEKYFKQLNY